MTFSPRVGIKNRQRGQQTHRGVIHSQGQVPNIYCKDCVCEEEKRACRKDDFLLPIIELMINSTRGYKALSFMDCPTRCNQIQMVLEDLGAITFRTPKGILYYKVMLFDLKNVGTTYQRVMQIIFDDMIHKIVEFYVDDLVVKSKKGAYHIQDLRLIFERLQRC